MTSPYEPLVVRFYDDELIAVQDADGTIYTLFAKLCENLGLERTAQIRRVQRHEILKRGLSLVSVNTSKGSQNVQCLRLDLLPLWLAGIQAGRVKPELQVALMRYQQEAAQVLWHAFGPRMIVTTEGVDDPTDAGIAELQRIAEMARAIASLAEQQLALQRQQQAISGRVDRAGQVVRALQGAIVDIHLRLDTLEELVQPSEPISKAQAAQVSQKVKALAELLTRAEPSKNFYQGIFGELYRRFRVSSYTGIPQQQFAAVIAFLDEWEQAAKVG